MRRGVLSTTMKSGQAVGQSARGLLGLLRRLVASEAHQQVRCRLDNQLISTESRAPVGIAMKGTMRLEKRLVRCCAR